MGLLFRLLVCPWLNVSCAQSADRRHAARRIVHHSFAFFVRLMQRLGIMQWRIEGLEKLQRNNLLVCASHPTLIDVVLLMSLLDEANCIVKASLRNSVSLRGPVLTTGYIANDEGPELIEAGAQSLADGDNLIIFPEGTRTRPGRDPRLQHGAAAIALCSGRNITPVIIRCTPPSLMKGIPWYKVPKSKMMFTITVCDDLCTAPFSALEQDKGRPIAVRHLTAAIKQQLFH